MAKRTKSAVATTSTTSNLVANFNIKDVQAGDIFSESSHYIYVGENASGHIFKHLESGANVTLTEGYVVSLLATANQYNKEVDVTKEDSKDGTKLGIRTIWDSIHSDKVFTVCFKKQDVSKSGKKYKEEVDAKLNELVAKIELAQRSKKGVANAAREALEDLANNPISKVEEGEDRVLKGFKIDFQSRDGKYNCMDMDIQEVRPVNINTIKWLVIDGVKYTVK